MKQDAEGQLCALLMLSFFTQIILGAAVSHIHDLGKSRSYLKKSRGNRPLWKCFLLIGYAQECKYYAAQAKGLTIAYWIGFLWPIVSMLCWALSRVFSPVLPVLRMLVYGKGILFDLPVFVFFFLMTKHAKNGGVTWKWESPR